MSAKKSLPETLPQLSRQFETSEAAETKEPHARAGAHLRMIDGFTRALLGDDAYFQAIDAQVERALSKQHGARRWR